MKKIIKVEFISRYCCLAGTKEKDQASHMNSTVTGKKKWECNAKKGQSPIHEKQSAEHQNTLYYKRIITSAPRTLCR